MVKVGVVGSLLEGDDGGEHNGHTDDEDKPLHPPSKLTGEIISGCGFAFINGKEIATVGSGTKEMCNCCGGEIAGVVTAVPNFVTGNGQNVVMVDHVIVPHHGTLTVKTGETL